MPLQNPIQEGESGSSAAAKLNDIIAQHNELGQLIGALVSDGDFGFTAQDLAALDYWRTTNGDSILDNQGRVAIRRRADGSINGKYEYQLSFGEPGHPGAGAAGIGIFFNDVSRGGNIQAIQKFTGPEENGPGAIGPTIIFGTNNSVDVLGATLTMDCGVGAIVFGRAGGLGAGSFKGVYYSDDETANIIPGQEDRFIPDQARVNALIDAAIAAIQALVPAGGTANQVLEKVDDTDYNTHWVDKVEPLVWNDLTLINGYTGTAKYTKDPYGIVRVKYTMTNSSYPGNIKWATLPAGYRPSTNVSFNVQEGGINLKGLQVESDGDCIFNGGPGTDLYPFKSFEVSFSVDV